MDENMNEPLLRPEFTKALAERLVAGESINLTAPHGYGRRQTVSELRGILPDSMRVLFSDIKFCLDDYSAMLVDLAAQAGMEEGNIHDLGQLIKALSKNPAPALLILHKFDRLRFETLNQPHDPLYDAALIPYLANFSVYPHLALLTVSEAPYSDWPPFCTGESKPQGNSTLPVTLPMPLPE